MDTGMEKINRRIAFIGFAVLMVGLGVSDSLRGIFSGIFQTHFSLTAKGLSTIIAVSYAGNLCFLLIGGRIMDKIDRKKAFLGFLAVWMCAMLIFLFTDNYYAILIGMFLAMGASTLLNTSITLITPFLFLTSPGMIVNLLFFTQGIGTSGGQSLIGNLAVDLTGWKVVTGVLFAIGVLAFLIILKLQIPEQHPQKETENNDRKPLKKDRLWILMVLIFGVYFIAEHGMLNWFVIYGTEALGLNQGTAANYMALFFGGITVGRLLFSPVIDRLKVFRSIALFSVISAVFYVAGIFSGALWLLAPAGLACSVIYPTLVMAIGRIYEQDQVSTMSGLIISIASLFDICFNYIYGDIAESIGYGRSFLIMPAAMTVFTLLFLTAFYKRILGKGQNAEMR